MSTKPKQTKHLLVVSVENDYDNLCQRVNKLVPIVQKFYVDVEKFRLQYVSAPILRQNFEKVEVNPSASIDTNFDVVRDYFEQVKPQNEPQKRFPLLPLKFSLTIDKVGKEYKQFVSSWFVNPLDGCLYLLKNDIVISEDIANQALEAFKANV